jgi:hypothetical protein
MVSLIGLAIAATGILLFSITVNVGANFIGVILLQISVFIDYSDGEVARYRKYEAKKNKASKNISGAFMDNMCHYILGPMAIFFFGYRHIYYFSDWVIPILVLGFLAAIAGIGIPNFAMSSIIVNTIQTDAKVLDNQKFRMIVSGRINIFLKNSKQISWFKKILLNIANAYKGVNMISLVSLLVLLELLFSVIDYNKIGSYVGLGGFVLLAVLLILNFVRTFRRNFLYLNKQF